MKLYINPVGIFLIYIFTFFVLYRDVDIIVVGENHTDLQDHRKQLEVIKDIYKHGKIIIAMEMFQQPFQDYLDEYIAGKLDENQMIDKTEYKRRWGYDFDYYIDILRFAKNNNIKVVGINIPTELVRQIREKGIENVESKYIPKGKFEYTTSQIEFIKSIFRDHKVKDEKKFFDVQLAWDLGMAYKIVNLKREFPDYKIVVLIGKGHQDAVKTFINQMDEDIEVSLY